MRSGSSRAASSTRASKVNRTLQPARFCLPPAMLCGEACGMQWQLLLSATRLGREWRAVPLDPARSEFRRDSDRIIFSSAFRRLQDKTQVFPLADNDYVRTRLTHSLEVASVGRSLGARVGAVICERHDAAWRTARISATSSQRRRWRMIWGIRLSAIRAKTPSATGLRRRRSQRSAAKDFSPQEAGGHCSV